MSWWQVGAVANAIIFVAYLAITVSIVRSLRRHDHWHVNPLAIATAGIFLTAAVHHGLHPLQQLLGGTGDGAPGAGMRQALDEWHLSIWDVLGAGFGLWYWALRARLPELVRRSALFGGSDDRERQALEIHDNVVQGVATAKLAFELDDTERGMRALDQTLAGARRIITELLDDSVALRMDRGDLRRDQPAGGSE